MAFESKEALLQASPGLQELAVPSASRLTGALAQCRAGWLLFFVVGCRMPGGTTAGAGRADAVLSADLLGCRTDYKLCVACCCYWLKVMSCCVAHAVLRAVNYGPATIDVVASVRS
jgi:hypothetical protein